MFSFEDLLFQENEIRLPWSISFYMMENRYLHDCSSELSLECFYGFQVGQSVLLVNLSTSKYPCRTILWKAAAFAYQFDK